MSWLQRSQDRGQASQSAVWALGQTRGHMEKKIVVSCWVHMDQWGSICLPVHIWSLVSLQSAKHFQQSAVKALTLAIGWFLILKQDLSLTRISHSWLPSGPGGHGVLLTTPLTHHGPVPYICIAIFYTHLPNAPYMRHWFQCLFPQCHTYALLQTARCSQVLEVVFTNQHLLFPQRCIYVSCHEPISLHIFYGKCNR